MGYAVVPHASQDSQHESGEESDTTEQKTESDASENPTDDSDSTSEETDTVVDTQTERESDTESDPVDSGPPPHATDSDSDEIDSETIDEKETDTMDAGTSDAPDAGAAELGRVALTWEVSPGNYSWISRKDNDLGIQGGWNAYADINSGINWLWEDITETRVCVSGNVKHVNPGWEFAYGAKVGFDTCGTRLPWDDNTAYPLARCPWSPDLYEQIIGFEFKLTGELPPTELRAQFQEQERSDGTYVLIDEPGAHQILFKNARLAYDENAPPINISEIIGFWFYIPSVYDEEHDNSEFDFCIENLIALTNP